MNVKCKGMKLTRKFIAPTTDQMIERLKKMIEQDEEEQLEQVNLLFGCSNYFSGDFILTAILEKLESDRENEEIDEHMQEEWDTAWDLANQLYAYWNFGVGEELA